MRKLQITVLTLLVFFGGASYADTASDEAVRTYYKGDRRGAERMFAAIAKQDPGNAEARYEMAYLLFSHDQITLEQFATEMRQTAELAAANGDTALGHYILAQLANNANDYGLALIEIDKALALESTSVRYLRAKMLYLFGMARPDKNADLVAEGIAVSEQALLQVTNDPKRYFTAGGMHFEIGRWLPIFRDEYLKLANEHFRSAATSGEISELTRAYSWGNMSGNLLRLKRCQEAKEAAETALSIKKYGSARGNLRKANKCLKRV